MRISDWSSDVCSSDLGFKRRAALGRGLPRLGEPLRKTECDERIMGAPAQKLASPEAEPRQAGRLLPFTQRWRGRRIRRAVRPCLSYDGGSEEHTSELQSLMRISYAVFCLKKKTTHTKTSQYPTHH